MPAWEPLGDSGFVFVFATTLDVVANARSHALAAAVRAAEIPGVADVVPAYASVAVALAPTGDPEAVRVRLARVAVPGSHVDRAGGTARSLTLPCCYDGPDLAELATHAGLSVDEVIARHAGGVYTVALLGFQPGFPYLLGLDPALQMPRRATPRPLVARGAVAIGGAQTGIYPRDSPGGWRLIGRTSAVLFEPHREPPSLLLPGDRVRFRATAAAELDTAPVEVAS